MNPSPPLFLPDGTVYGTLLNFHHELALWAARAAEPPYKGAPKAPVLFIKTANTFSPQGAAIPLPARVAEVDIGASVGLVIGNFEDFEPLPGVAAAESAINNEASAKLPRVVGCVLLNDLSIPHDSYYRPPVKFKCLDGFLGIGPRCVPLTELGNVNTLKLEVRVNGDLRQTVDLAGLVRDAATLLADVNAFMTLQPGDVLLLGSDCLPDGTRPRARVGDRIEISAPGFEPLVNTLVGEKA